MSNWDEFSSGQISGGDLAAEDRQRITNAEEYLLFRESVFSAVCDEFLRPPSVSKPDLLRYDIVNSSNRTHTLFKRMLRWSYHGFDRVSYGKTIVEETSDPRGYRIIYLSAGMRQRRNKWISWEQAWKRLY